MHVPTEDSWLELLAKAEAVFDLAKRLPERVDRLRASVAPIFDPGWVTDPDFWVMVSSLAALHQDRVVHFVTLDPDKEHFLDASGRYGAFTIEVTQTADDYYFGLTGRPDEHNKVNIQYVGDVMALFGDSGDWGVWAQRDVCGLFVSRDPARLALWEVDHGPFLTAEEAIDGLMRMYYRGGIVPEPFSQGLRRNYSPFGLS